MRMCLSAISAAQISALQLELLEESHHRSVASCSTEHVSRWTERPTHLAAHGGFPLRLGARARRDGSGAAQCRSDTENIPGTNTASARPIALDIGGGGGTHSLLDEPIDVGTQVARKQGNDDRNFQWNADFVWTRRKHTWSSAPAIHFLPTLHCAMTKLSVLWAAS